MKKAKSETPIKDLPSEDIEALLQDSLNEDDLEEAKAIKREVSAVVNWGDLTQSVSHELFNLVEALCCGDLPELTKSKPVETLVGDARRIMESTAEDTRTIRYMVSFLIIKKLLGALKTDVNKKIEAVRILTPAETEAVEEIVADLALLTEAEKVNWGNDDLAHDAEIVARLESTACEHHKTIVRANTEKETLETFCKDCRNVVASYSSEDLGLGRLGKKREPKKCTHRYLAWVEGEEGKIAECRDKSDCTYKETDADVLKRWGWEKVGLEPYGDDSTQDEVIDLCL